MSRGRAFLVAPMWAFVLGALCATGIGTWAFLAHHRHHVAVCQPNWNGAR